MNPALTHIHDALHQIKSEIQKEIIGQDLMIEKLIITFFAGGHALLEGVPGLGKTKTIRTFARVLTLDTGRVSFTPDLLPSDLTGNEIYRPQKGEFRVRKGPIFTHILLADEINRTPPKVQSALLEAMEEKKVTIGDTTFELPSPFVVFATQNPLEHEGTYPLPEAQLDRFLMRIMLSYPSREDEKRIFLQETILRHPLVPIAGDPSSGNTEHELPTQELGNNETKNPGSYTSMTPTDLLETIDYIAKSIRVDEKIFDYIGDILTSLRKLTESRIEKQETRIKGQGSNFEIPNSEFGILAYGPSSRAGLSLIRAGRVRALMAGRDYMLPEDVKSLAHDILDHRIGLSYESTSEGITTWQVTEKVLDSVRIP